ncbi:hypothetical protein EDC31_104147 [Acidomonas methanolica]|nr:hypothetical protein EDC31_104147 [Acidomonas methanolica]
MPRPVSAWRVAPFLQEEAMGLMGPAEGQVEQLMAAMA